MVRTHSGDDAAWSYVCELIRQPVHERGVIFLAQVDFIESPLFCDRAVNELLAMVPPQYGHTFLFIVDNEATRGPEFPVLVLDLWDEPGRTFRAVPSQIGGIENNLSMANMDFREFADNVAQDGIFRGFKRT